MIGLSWIIKNMSVWCHSRQLITNIDYVNMSPEWGLLGYHADAEDGEEQEPGQVCAAPVLQRFPFSLCPLKHTQTHRHSGTGPEDRGRQVQPVPDMLARFGSARFSSRVTSHKATCRPGKAAGRRESGVGTITERGRGGPFPANRPGNPPVPARS